MDNEKQEKLYLAVKALFFIRDWAEEFADAEDLSQLDDDIHAILEGKTTSVEQDMEALRELVSKLDDGWDFKGERF